jgi:Tfp pilus tip-associated adhesin PilY1
MLGALGWGGNGFYAMDVTAAGSTPSFLWAIDNARYAERESNLLDGVKRWGNAAGGVKINYDYSDLGLTIVAPELFSTDTADVGFIPGGLGYNFGADNHGKAFYIFNPQNGEIIKKIDNNNGYIGPGSLGMGVAPVVYFMQGGKTIEFFTGDSEGNVLYCNTTEAPENWNLKSIFRLRTEHDDNPVALTKALEIGKASDGNRWLFGGTSDLMVPDFSEARTLRNDEQHIFGLNLTKAMNESTPVTLSDLVSLKYLKTSPDIEPSYGETGNQNSVQSEDPGWTLKLRPKLPHDTDPTDAEYVVTSPFLYNGVLYVSTFVPRTRHPDDQEQCRDVGDGKLYALDPLTGGSQWKNGTEQALLFKDIKIVGISSSRGNLFLGIKILKPGASQNLSSEIGDYKFHASNTVLEIPPAKVKRAKPKLKTKIPHLQYWRESF